MQKKLQVPKKFKKWLSATFLMAMLGVMSLSLPQKDLMVFTVGDYSGIFKSANAQATLGGQSTIRDNRDVALIGPETCEGVNAYTGQTYTEPSARANGRGFCPKVYTCDTNVAGSCTNPVTGATMPSGYKCRVGVYKTGTGDIASRALPLDVIDCARQGLEARFTQPAGGRRMPNVGTYIGEDGCYVKYDFTHPPNGTGRPNTICGTSSGAWAGYEVETGTGNLGTTGSVGSTGSSGGNGASSGSVVNRAFAPYGMIEEIGTSVAEGWALDPANLATSIRVRAYVGDTYIGEFVANNDYKALPSRLGLPNVAGADMHGLRIPLPAGISTGTLVIYAVNPNGGPNPELDRKTIGSAPETTPTGYIPASAVSNSRSEAFGSGGSQSQPVDRSCELFGCSELGMLEQQRSVGQQQAMCQYAYGILGYPTFDRCKVDPGDGGTSCDIPTRGAPSQREIWQICAERFEACYANPSANGGSYVYWGFCDPVKYADCREAGVFENPGSGVLDVNACNKILLEGGCSEDPQNCDVREILGLGAKSGGKTGPSVSIVLP